MTQHKPLEVIEFKAPPPPRNGGAGDWKAKLESALKSSPGVWALVAKDTYVTNGQRHFKNDPRYETRRDYCYPTRNRVDLYMRYVGDKNLTHKK